MSQLRAGTGKRGWLGPAVGVAVLTVAVVWWFGMRPATMHEPTEPITRFLLAVATILLVCHVFGALLRKLGQPAVLGEIIGGLLLGPSVFGLVAPQARDWLFPEHILSALDTAAQLGLIVFLFLLGCELRLGAIERKRVVAATVLGGTGLPFLGGVVVAILAGPAMAGDAGSTTTHVLFMGLALSITALPVLARILVDLRIDRSDTGVISLTSAAVGDGLTWIALAVIMAMAGAGDASQLLPRLGLAVAFLLVMLLCVRPAVTVLVNRITSGQGLVAALVIGAVASAALAQQIDLHPMIAAFLFGTLVPRTDAVTRVNEQLQGFTITILLPLFFAGVGLDTSFGLVGGDLGRWLLFALVLVTAMGTKFVGAGGGAFLVGVPRRQALQIGTLMNCRGITELVVATVGLQAGLINTYGFTVLVLVAVITSAMTGVVMRRLERTAVPTR
jgi:Kef-type K+ transport system membrane component KefB